MSMPQQSHTTSRITWTNASTRSVDVSGTKFVYRQLGADGGVPVIFLNHLAAELDRWDPRVVDGIAIPAPRDRLRQPRRYAAAQQNSKFRWLRAPATTRISPQD